MALGDTLNQVNDATSGVQEGGPGGALAKNDPAKTDVQGKRKGAAEGGEVEGDDEKDPKKPKERDSSLKIKIELNIDVEVHLTARVKGDITIGLL